jgi:serine/threonine protein phosphatase PrpC
LCKAGEITPAQIRFHEDRNRLLRSLGNSGFNPTIRENSAPLEPQDAFLLCSDGFWEYVNEREMEADLATAPGPKDWLTSMEARLKARVKSEHDNYSAIAVWFRA